MLAGGMNLKLKNLMTPQNGPICAARVVHTGRLRDFFGFNRAKHAVLEAAILATRVHLLPPEELIRQVEALAIPVEKTAGPQEQEAFDLLRSYILQAISPDGSES